MFRDILALGWAVIAIRGIFTPEWKKTVVDEMLPNVVNEDDHPVWAATKMFCTGYFAGPGVGFIYGCKALHGDAKYLVGQVKKYNEQRVPAGPCAENLQ